MKIFILNTCVLLPLFLYGQTGGNFPSTSSLSRGGSFTTWNDVQSVFLNFTSLEVEKTTHIAVNGILFSGVPGVGGARAVFARQKEKATWLVGVSRIGHAEFFRSQLSLGLSHSIGHTTIGGRIKWIQLGGFNHSLFHFASLDIASHTRLTSKWNVGLYISDANTPIISREIAESIPLLMSVGLGYQFSEKVRIALEITQVENLPLKRGLGIYYRWKRSLGFSFGVSDNPGRFHTGLSLTLDSKNISYAVSSQPVIGLIQSCSASYSY